MPFVFLFMDTPFMFEYTFRMLWGDEFTEVTGTSLIEGFSFGRRREILELALEVTVGDKIKDLVYDRVGNLINLQNIQETTHLVHTKIP